MFRGLCQVNLLRKPQLRLVVPVIYSSSLPSYLSWQSKHDPSPSSTRYHHVARTSSQSNFPASSLLQTRLFSKNNKDSEDASNETIPSSWIRLSKRMSELDICSRREADRLIRSGLVTVNGQVAMLAEKVPPNLEKSQILIQWEDGENDSGNNNATTTVVMNKPQGYVSGQAEHGHPPAIRLLTPDRLWDGMDANKATLELPFSWRGYAPAGRLDLHSTGLLVFSSSGIVAKKLIHSKSQVTKEYVVHVEAANQVSKREKQLDPTFQLPKPSTDLTPLWEGGRTLLGSEHKPLLPCVDAEWTEEGKVLRLVLMEGRKHHIRRLCREVLGYHVVKLQRVRIGPIKLGDLPEGCWRPVTKEELDVIME